MDFMEQKEQLAEKMQTIRSQDVKTFICMQCHTTLQKQSEYCRSQGHKPLEAIAKKRFFKCRICHSRQEFRHACMFIAFLLLTCVHQRAWETGT